MNPPVKVGVTIPVFNEPRVRGILPRFDFNVTPLVALVDDGSTDGSVCDAPEGGPLRVLRHGERRGVGAAIRTGLEHLREQGCDVAVVMAGNGKDDPGDIPGLVGAIADGADYVQGSRYLEPERALGTPWKRRVITRAVAGAWSVRFRRRLSDVTNGFRAYRLSLLDDPRIDVHQPWLDRYELEYYLHYKILSLGYRYAEVPVHKQYPSDGKPVTKIRLTTDAWSLVRPLVLLSLRMRD
jgi:dolichol-phosphate mannosyltransferase